MDDSFFKVLNKKETAEFKQWARENHKIGDRVEPIWHPVVREECKRIDEERGHGTG